MRYLTKQEAQQILGPYEASLFRIPINAVRDYVQAYSGVKFNHTKRTDASTIHDLMVTHAINELDVLPEFTLKESYGLRYFQLSSDPYSVVLRFKKFDGRKLASNILTQQAFSFMNQAEELPGMPPMARIQIGYILTPTRTAVQGVYATLPHEGRNIWAWELQDTAQQRALGNIQALPPSFPQSDTIRRATPRKDVAEEESDVTDETR